MSDKERFIGLLKEIKRDGIEKLISNLEKSDFFTAPASTQYHDSVKGGLCKHSLNVYEKLTAVDIPNTSMESMILVALLHDVCKIGFYKVSSRNVKNEKGLWESVPYYSIDDSLPLGHGEKSVIMLLQDIKLTVEEMMAIRWHMAGYEPKENYNALSKAFSEFPLALELHIADMRATYLK